MMDEKYKIEQRVKNVWGKRINFPKFFITLFIKHIILWISRVLAQ